MKRIAFVVATMLTSLCSATEAILTFENDAILKGGEDNDYTHGTRGEVVTDGGYHFMLSQTMYAPDDLRKEHHVKGERPYAGMLLGGIGYEFFQDPASPWTHYGEFNFGVIGPAAMCKETQTAVHKLLNCRKPMGWDDQLHNEVVANAQWWTKYNWMPFDWLAVVPKAGAAAGTIQDFAEIGCDVKIGWNIRPTPNNEIMFSATANGKRGGGWLDKLTAYVYAGVGERFYLYNHLLEGSMFGNRDKDLKVDKEPFVTEFHVGAVVRYERFFATYYAVFRTDEYKGQKDAPDYGGIGIGWSW